MMRVLSAALAILLLSASGAQAACTSPAGSAGDMIYSQDYRAVQYCDGSVWITGGRATYNPTAVTFDGVNDYLGPSAISGLADGKTVTGSFWFRRAHGNAGEIHILNTAAGRFAVFLTTSGYFTVSGFTSGGLGVLSVSANTATTDTNWHHALFSFDMTDTAKRFVYIDGVAMAVTYYTYSNLDIDFTQNYFVGDDQNGTAKWQGDIADLWIDPGTYIDLSVTANREKFIKNGKPVYLGSNGSLPTGTAPEIFLSGAAATWHTNDGTGGGFTLNGALTTAHDNVIEPGYSRSAERGPNVTNGLVAWWKLDESAGTAADSSGNGQTGTVNGGGVWQPTKGTIKGAMSFDGVDDTVSFTPSGSIPGPGAAKTISLWFNQNINIGNNGMFVMTNNSNTGLNIMDSAALNVSFWGGGSLGTSIFPTSNEWHHVVYTYDGTTHRLYYEGAEAASNSAIPPDPGSYTIGSIGSAYGVTPMNGHIDDVRIYDRALGLDEVRQLYIWGLGCASPDGSQGDVLYNDDDHVLEFCNGRDWVAMGPLGAGGAGCASPAGDEGDIIYNDAHDAMQYCDGADWISFGGGKLEAPGTEAGLIHHWTFDNTPNDAVGANNGTLVNAPTYTTTAKMGQAINLDGVNQAINVGAITDLSGSSGITFSAWVRPGNTVGAFDEIISDCLTSACVGATLRVGTNPFGGTNIRTGLLGGALTGSDLTGSTGLAAGTWYHITATYDGATARIYVNGVEDGSVASTHTLVDTVTTYIGSRTDSGSAWHGIIDDVRIYNRALTQGEINRLYKATGGGQ